ncbi:MAG TPA: hypothetical protein VKG92_07755, partial [Flavobacteriales bacterium]|nr:hypothetical protein [Flavobacteriales bacterium]
MSSPTSPQAFIIAVSLFCHGAVVNARWEQVLYIDGKVRTEGVPLDGTRILVERDGIMVQVVSEDVGRIRLRLDLQRVYILSFERVGCMTKQLLFDTHVPGEGLMSAPFSFPFKVTLEESDESTLLQYTQPVGFVRYYPGEKDFGYDTDYRMRRYSQRDEDRIANAAETPDAGSPMIPGGPKVGSADPDPGTPTTALMDRPVLVEVLTVRATTPLPNLPRSATPPEPGPATSAGSVMRPTPKAAPRVSREEEVVRTVPRPRPVVTRVIHVPRKEAEVLPDGRTEEIQVDRNAVTTTVRITKAGHTREFRRVAHQYGAVHYFFNGL